MKNPVRNLRRPPAHSIVMVGQLATLFSLTTLPAVAQSETAPGVAQPPAQSSAQSSAQVSAPAEATPAARAANEQSTPAPPLFPLAPPMPPAEPVPNPVTAKWNTSFYGFVEMDAMSDSTQSFNEGAGNGAIVPRGYPSEHGRTIFGARNSRLGFKIAAPEFGDGLKASAIAEMDFLGNQPSPVSEGALYNNPTFRIRHMALMLETPVVDLRAGQYWHLFGWQSGFHPATVEIQGVPGQVYSRTQQFRVSKTLKGQDTTLEVALAATRPAQRNSSIPDGEAGVKLSLPGWKGVHTGGSTGTALDGLSIGVSGVLRRFKLPEFAAAPVGRRGISAWGVSVDALVPIVQSTLEQRANALALTGSFVVGSGIADMYSGLNGGVGYPALPKPSDGTATPVYTPDIDSGLVTYDANGKLHTIDWQSYIVGLQYYLPPSGKVWLAVNYSAMKSNNIADYTGDAALSKIFTRSYWADANVFVDVTPAVRFGAEYAYFHQRYADDMRAHNHRVQLSGFFIF